MIPEREWLAQAQRLAVGMRVRVRHGNERRQNMVIANAGDRFWCYCQACKDGGVVKKEHVRLGVFDDVASRTPVSPTDLAPLTDREYRFLASKGMDAMYFMGHYLTHSPSRRRLIVHTPQGMLGRDLSGLSGAKWIAYGAFKYVAPAGLRAITVLTEDVFSAYKVQFAMRGNPDIGVYCTLGTALHDAHILDLLGRDDVRVFYDGDEAGRHGAAVATKRLRALGVPAVDNVLTPWGSDPKDLTLADICDLLEES